MIAPAGPCRCLFGAYVEKVYELGGLQFDDSYCGLCSKPWKRQKPRTSPVYLARRSDLLGTSIAPTEAGLRDIGRRLFSIEYPGD